MKGVELKALTEYRKKRDFKKTPEPGAVVRRGKRAPKERASFVVQEHHASHLHYDFRLEVDGVLKSWAVPKGPVMDRKVKRLAVEVEDHPLAYGSFHGRIPEGEYGAGEVFIWDKGTWEPKGDPRAALKKGHLDFTLNGGKLQGDWMLIRTRNARGGKNQWLLMYRGRATKDAADEEPAAEPARKSDADGFIAPELAELVATPPEGDDWLHEMKFDGYRVQAHLGGEPRLLTRTGKDWADRYPAVAKTLKRLRHRAVLDGEVVALDDKGRSDFQLLQNAVAAGDSKRLAYFVFDLLSLDGRDLRSLPLRERKEKLRRLLGPLKDSNVFFSDHLEGRAADFLKTSCRFGLEGIVSKRADAPYVSGRNDNWLKSKCQKRQEFVIGGYTSGKRDGFGALLLGVYERGKFRYVGRVGTGFDQKGIAALAARLRRLERRTSPFEVKSPRGAALRWVEPKLAAEISFSNWTRDRRLRVPVFHGLREDKPAEEIHVERPLTHPDKIVYRKEKLTKRDIADYYTAAAARLLPHLADRPLTLVRCPDGAAGACFYQKHRPNSLPDSVKELTLPKGMKGQKDLMAVDGLEGLLALVQQGSFEFHVANSRAPRLDRPDQIVMDLDPDPSVPWAKVKNAAFELRSLLRTLGLESFVKVTGGKGIHVHVPFEPRYGWTEVKSFARAVAEELASREPDLYLTKMSKAARKGRIFIDYLRNDAHATAVLPYSLRARKVSAVALPVSWRELPTIRGGDEFDLRAATARLKGADPWRDFFKTRQRVALLEGKKKPALKTPKLPSVGPRRGRPRPDRAAERSR